MCTRDQAKEGATGMPNNIFTHQIKVDVDMLIGRGDSNEDIISAFRMELEGSQRYGIEALQKHLENLRSVRD